jgi:hypothetical protein
MRGGLNLAPEIISFWDECWPIVVSILFIAGLIFGIMLAQNECVKERQSLELACEATGGSHLECVSKYQDFCDPEGQK